MLFDNPCEHNGYLVTGRAVQLYAGKWQAQLLIERQGFVSEGMGVAPLCMERIEAEQQAVAVGRRIVDGASFALLTAAELPRSSNSIARPKHAVKSCAGA